MSIQSELRRDEGYRIWPYKDSRGILTWGIGHNLKAAPLCNEAAAFLGQAIQAQFDHDLATVNEALHSYPWITGLSQPRIMALQNMMFNLGPKTFGTFTTFLGLLQEGNYSGAADDLRKSLAFKQDTARYTRIANQIESGVEQ